MVSECAGWLIAILFAANVAMLQAQSLTISIGGGYERGDARIEFTRADSNRYNNVLEDGIDQIGAFGEISFPVCAGSPVVVAARLSAYAANVQFRAPRPDVMVLIPGEDELQTDKVEEEISFSMLGVQVELISRVAIVKGLNLGVGTTLGYKVVQDYRRSELHSIPLWGMLWGSGTIPVWPRQRLPYVQDNGHRLVLDDESSLQQNHLAIGALFIAEYEFPLTQQLSLVPELRLRGDFTSPFPNTNWNLFSAGGALSVRYSL
jgi:hypothetical protein